MYHRQGNRKAAHGNELMETGHMRQQSMGHAHRQILIKDFDLMYTDMEVYKSIAHFSVTLFFEEVIFEQRTKW